MSDYTREQAESDISMLYGWPEEYGPQDDASDEFVIRVALDQQDWDDLQCAAILAARPVPEYCPRTYTWR